MKPKSIAIMQPYLFPYIGYWQLINSVDVFVVYDDVNFIKKGWIHRNNILVNNQSNMFTIPLFGASQNKKIYEITFFELKKWKEKFFKKLFISYKKAPFYKETQEILESIFNIDFRDRITITDLFVRKIEILNIYLGIDISIIISSEKYNNTHLKGQDRIIDICKKENAEKYINPIGGIDLYSSTEFSKNNIDLFFLKTKSINYRQFHNEFVPWLSIIDILMFNSPIQIKNYLNEFELV